MIRSNLYIPANKEKYIDNIKTLDADIYTLDLEDSLCKDEKEHGRNIIKGLNIKDKNVYIRVNNIYEGSLKSDTDVITINNGIKGVCYPKCKDEDELKKLDHQLLILEKLNKMESYSIKVQLLIENTLAVLNIEKLINSINKRITTLVFGIVDYCNDLGIDVNYKSVYVVRSLIAYTARAYRLDALDCPYIDFHDEYDFIEDTKISAGLGYRGRLVIHPKQIRFANKLYVPSNGVINKAREIVKAYEYGIDNKQASISYNGGMIANAVYVNAKKILERVPDN